jgi:hypothetical protein
MMPHFTAGQRVSCNDFSWSIDIKSFVIIRKKAFRVMSNNFSKIYIYHLSFYDKSEQTFLKYQFFDNPFVHQF